MIPLKGHFQADQKYNPRILKKSEFIKHLQHANYM